VQGSGLWRRFFSCHKTITQVFAYANFTGIGISYENFDINGGTKNPYDTEIFCTDNTCQIRSILPISRFCCSRCT
jgi:hypothetical protein